MKILIIQLRRIGDVMFTLPCAQVLRKLYPQAQIDFLAESPSNQLLNLSPDLSNVFCYNKKNHWSWMLKIYRQHYDVVFDFHANGRALWLTMASRARQRLGFKGKWNRELVYTKSIAHDPELFITDDKMRLLKVLSSQKLPSWQWTLNLPQTQKKQGEKLLNSLLPNDKKVVGLLAVHRHSIRCWKKKHWRSLAAKIIEQGHSVLWLGGPGEEEELKKYNQGLGSLSAYWQAQNLLEMSSLIEQCSVLVANDNGPQKIAMALNRPTITIFGPTNPVTINPRSAMHQALRDEALSCIGCEKSSCPTQQECMQNIYPDTVFKLLSTYLK